MSKNTSFGKKTVRLDRLLSNLGYGSRKEVGALIRKGLVTIQGHVVDNERKSVFLAEVQDGNILLDGRRLDPYFPMVVMLNKPAGYTCSRNDSGLIIFDILPYRWLLRKPRISIAGRLDKDSTGLVLLTDDGQLLHKIITPRKSISKYYRVTLRDPLRGDEADIFASGEIMLKGEKKPLLPANWQAKGTNFGVMQLSEGRNRQIRRMFEHLGNEVIELHRYRIGGLELGDLAEGKYRQLSGEEVAQLFVSPE